jgi:Ca2+-binding RTX toxin-like protein
MSGNAIGGNDTLIGSATDFTINILQGDAGVMQGDSRGGNDTLIGGGVAGGVGTNLIFGDAMTMSDNAIGGNDILTGGAGPTSNLFGDAQSMSGNARGGNDTLISGPGTDYMWGDAEYINGVLASPTAPTGNVVTGADTFVFAPGSGNDYIGDFRQSDGDKIDVSAYGFHSLVNMMITFDGANTKISFDANDSVTLVGFGSTGALQTSDFKLA